MSKKPRLDAVTEQLSLDAARKFASNHLSAEFLRRIEMSGYRIIFVFDAVDGYVKADFALKRVSERGSQVHISAHPNEKEWHFTIYEA